jgi:hypothetical protein
VERRTHCYRLAQTASDKTDPEALDPDSPDAAHFQNRTAPNQYKKVQISIPVGAEINWIIRRSWNIGATFGVRLTTGRYLDDLGGHYFDRINGHKAIVDANMDKITGRTRHEKGLSLPNQVTFMNDQGLLVTRDVAALLANPSYASGDANNYAYSIEEPYDNHDARRSKGGAGNYDIYFFGGVKVTKIFRRERDDDKKEAPKDAYQKEKDSDGDGLSDEEEKKLGTKTNSTDSDGDGVSDKKEREAGTNPTGKDSDGDSIIDGKDKCPKIPGTKENQGCPKSN